MHMQVRAVVLALAVVLILASGCGEESCLCPEIPSASDYSPLSVGSNWTYFRGSSVDSFWIDSTWTQGDTTFFVKSGRTVGGPSYFNTFNAVYSDGSVWALLYDLHGFEYAMILPSWPSVGQEWVRPDRDTVRIAADTTISVPAGTFECLKVVRWRHASEPDDPGVYLEAYYAPGVGPVMYRESEGFAPQDAEVERELRSYSVR